MKATTKHSLDICHNTIRRVPTTPLLATYALVAVHDGHPVEVLTANSFYGKGNGMQPVRVCVWINLPAGGGYRRTWLAGQGKAGGCGYHKESAALDDALGNAGIKLDHSISGSSVYFDAFSAIADMAGFTGPYLLIRN
jgi:hypothetical protein